MDVPVSGVLRFGELALDLATGELHRAGEPPVVLGARPAHLLALLAWRHGQLVTRDDIQRHVWSDGTTVEFDQNINHHIRQLRQILGDSAAHPVWIQTLPARGYRFLVASALDPAPTATAHAGPVPVANAAAVANTALVVTAAPDANTAAATMAAPVVDAAVVANTALVVTAAPDDNTAAATMAAPVADAAPVANAALVADVPAPAIDPSMLSVRPRVSRKRRRFGAVTLIGVALAALVVTTSDSASVATRQAADPGTAVRLAVLPLSCDPADEARALAATEELIAALGEAYAPGLEVIALRTVLRYRGTTAPPSTIARELGVDFVLEGRVRTQLDRARITLGLVRARDSANLWVRTFEQSQRDWTTEAIMAQDVAAALGRVLLPHRSRPDAVLDAEAQHDLLRGRYLLWRDPRAAARAFAEVTERFPRSARAWAARGLAELRSGPDRASAAAAAAGTALELDPAHSEAHFVRGVTAFVGEWDAERGRQHFVAAIAANPAFAEAHHSLAGCYSASGRHGEAIAAMQRAFALDPLAPQIVSDVGWYYYFARRFADAAVWCRRTLELDPRFYWAHRCIVMAHSRHGDTPAAIAAALDHLRALGAPASVADAVSAGSLAPYWRWEAARQAPEHGAGDYGDRAVARIALGDTSGALDDLERAVATRRAWLVPFLAVDPTFDELRGLPRFQAVLRTVAAGASL